MLKLDFHSFTNTTLVGYGRAFQDIRGYLHELCHDGVGVQLADNYTGGDVQIFFGTPINENKGCFDRKSDRFIIFTMWESDRIESSVLANLHLFDEIIVPSGWCKKVFRECGLKQKIHVIPLGIKVDDWPLLNRKRAEDDRFTFLWQGHICDESRDRKGSKFVVDAFNSLNLPNAELVLKANHKLTKARIPARYPLTPNGLINVILESVPQAELINILNYVDCSIYPSYGEGFGLIPLEHMATGLPVILSNNSSLSDYCDPDYTLPISCTPKCSISGSENGADYLPDINELKWSMEWAYNNQEKIKAMGIKASSWVKKNWDIKNTAKRIIELCLNGQTG